MLRSLLVLTSFLTSALATTCSYQGLSGTCQSTSNSCSNGYYQSGQCPGAANIQCCIQKSCSSGGVTGHCQNNAVGCNGHFQSGLCPGDSSIECCLPSSGGGGNLPGLNSVQTGHARVIISVAHQRGLPIRACEVAMATALVESSVLVYANSNVPSSYNYPHDAVGSDHESVGIFQQQPQYWGTVQDCMDPASSAGKFYAALVKVGNWQGIPIGTAAQDVQNSAYPDRYQAQAGAATNICSAGF